MEVFGYYEGGSGYSSTTTTTALISAVAGAFGGVNGGSGYEQATYDAFEGAYATPGGMAINGTADDKRPAAYLNYILFDEDMVYYQHGHAQISTAADMNHEKISINDIVAPKAGFVYVYVSNESVAANWTYFDDMKVVVTEGSVVQRDNFYPFGLQHSGGYQRITAKRNDFLYNGFELQKSLDWNVYDYQARYYDPVLGRFLNVDPAADLMRRHSPYNYAFDNPIRFIDPDGMVPEEVAKGPCGDKPCDDQTLASTIAVDLLETKHSLYNIVLAAVGSDTRAQFVETEDGYKTGFVESKQSTGEKWLSFGIDVVNVATFGKGGGVTGGILAKTPAKGAVDDVIETTIDASKKSGDGTLVRFGQEAETTEGLAEQAAKAEAHGFPHGVSTKKVEKLQKSDKI
ncbi:RHS repeat-associated core domain-containing protein, partial [Fulvivirga kasyanovii]